MTTTTNKESLNKACNIIGISRDNRHYFVEHAIDWLAQRQAIRLQKVNCNAWSITGADWTTAHETLIQTLANAVILCKE